jgi:adhesin transport system outer membrane protein
MLKTTLHKFYDRLRNRQFRSGGVGRIALIAVYVGLGCSIMGCFAPAQAEDYRDKLQKMVMSHRRIGAANANLKAAESGESLAWSNWYPTLTARANIGQSTIRTSAGGSPETNLMERQNSLSLQQPLWDFGQIGGGITKAQIGVKVAKTALSQAEQDLLLEGLIAYITLSRTAQDQAYAERSVENVQRQTGLEQSRVDLGGGVTSDVLQAKSQLAGAQARLVRAKGATVNAVSRFRALFGRDPDGEDRQQTIPVPFESLPSSLDLAIQGGRDRNYTLATLKLATESARAELERVRGAQLFPSINGVASAGNLNNVSGVKGNRTELTVGVAISFPFNTGLAAFHSIDAARQAIVAADDGYAEASDLIEEQVRNSWKNLETARLNADHLQNQARIAAEFLRLAQMERQQGRRSLIDILSGETTLINAQSDAVSAQADIAIAAFALLKVTSLLEPSLLR